jgi:preprotein translocase subunit SecF
MKKTNIDRIKFFIVATLSLVLVGLVLIGVFGFNTTVDYPNDTANGYELQVSVDQNAGNAYELLKSSTEEYFTANGLTPSGVVQKISDGKALVYKFKTDVTEKAAGLAAFVDGKLEAAGLTTVEVSADVYQLSSTSFDGVWTMVLACGIAVVAIFVYALIMEKLAGSLATVFSSVVAAILFVALLGITRIPAAPFVGIGAAAAAVIAGASSVATVNRYREEAKNNANLSAAEVIEKVAASERNKYIILGAAIAVTAIALAVFGVPYLMIVSGQLLLAGVAGTFSAYLGSAFMWAAIKNAKRK